VDVGAFFGAQSQNINDTGCIHLGISIVQPYGFISGHGHLCDFGRRPGMHSQIVQDNGLMGNFYLLVQSDRLSVLP
jgi:hypothetical protein